MKIRLNNVRLAFPALFEAKTVNGEGDPLSLRLSFLLVIIRSLMKSVRRWTKWVLKMGRKMASS